MSTAAALKISAQRAAFLKAFSLVASIVKSRTPMPLLEYVLFKCEKGLAVLQSTDMEVSIVIPVDVQCDEDFNILLHSQRTMSILRELDCEGIEISTIDGEESSIIIEGNGSKFTLPVVDTAKYPSIKVDRKDDGVFVGGEQLRLAIKRVAVLANEADDQRYSLHSVCVEINNGKLATVASDGKRVSYDHVEVTETVGKGLLKSSLMPPKAAQLLVSSIDSDEPVYIQSDDSRLTFYVGDLVVSTLLVAGRFVPWKLVAKSAVAELGFNIDASYFASTIRQSLITANKETRSIDVEIGDGVMSVVGFESDVGESTINRPVDYKDTNVSIVINGDYVLGYLRNTDGEIHVGFTAFDNHGARSVILSQGSYICVIATQSRS